LCIRRDEGVARAGKSPVLTTELRRMVAALPPNLLGVRERAILLVGFAGGFRRSELVGLDFPVSQLFEPVRLNT
jgi:site-specific recombinase XerC